jgi:hypothetical protein
LKGRQELLVAHIAAVAAIAAKVRVACVIWLWSVNPPTHKAPVEQTQQLWGNFYTCLRLLGLL